MMIELLFLHRSMRKVMGDARFVVQSIKLCIFKTSAYECSMPSIDARLIE